MRFLPAFLVAIGVLVSLARAEPSTRPAFRTGVDTNYALEMESKGQTWSDASGAKVDPFEHLAKAGVDSVRIRLWTGDTGTNGLDYALRTAQRARRRACRPTW
ncbi:MAG: glycosyl hydrolase 53 family protein [Tepidisphaeraceae bacterium]